MNPARHRARRLAVSSTYDGAFTLKIDTTKAGSASDTFVLPVGTGYSMNAVISWGDGTIDYMSGGATTSYTHVYPAPGVYIVRIWERNVGGAGTIYFYDSGDKLKVMELMQWGANKWGRMESAFYGCANMLITATDAWKAKTQTVATFKQAFRGCTSLKHIIMPNTSGCTNMLGIFKGCTSLPAVPFMDTSKVTDLTDAFGGCSALKAVPLLDTRSATQWVRTFEVAGLSGYDFPTLDMHAMANGTNCFYGFGISKAAYNSILDQLANGRGGIAANANTSVTFHAGSAHYDASTGGYDGTAARGYLTGTKTWTITDGGTP